MGEGSRAASAHPSKDLSPFPTHDPQADSPEGPEEGSGRDGHLTPPTMAISHLPALRPAESHVQRSSQQVPGRG